MGWESFPAANVSKLRHELYGCHVQDISAKLIAQGGLAIMSIEYDTIYMGGRDVNLLLKVKIPSHPFH